MNRFLIYCTLLLVAGCNSLVEPKWDYQYSTALPVEPEAPLTLMAKEAQRQSQADSTNHLEFMEKIPQLNDIENDEQNKQAFSGVSALSDGVEAFAVRNALIKNAQTSLDLQYYILHKGLSTRLLIREVIRAANRGVSIRILVDDMDMLGRDKEMTLLSAHPNIQVRTFNPIRAFRDSAMSRSLMLVTNLKTQHRRMHNKQLIADGVLGILGGRNIGDQYFNAGEHDNFADLDVLLSGPIVKEMAMSFDAYWNSTQAFPVDAFEKKPDIALEKLQKILFNTNSFTLKERVANHPYLKALHEAEDLVLPRVLGQMSWGAVNFFADLPEKITKPPRYFNIKIPEKNEPADSGSVPLDGLIPYLRKAQKTVFIVSAYFVPGKSLSKLLIDLAKKGVRVVVLTNSLESNDVAMASGPYQKYRTLLLKSGVDIYELRAFPDVGQLPQWRLPVFTWKGSRAQLHAKAVIIDGTTSFIGSINLDGRSIVWNTEVAVIVKQATFAQNMHRLFLNAIENRYSYHVTIDNNGRLNWSSDHINKPALRKEPGSFWRKVQRNFGKLIPESYL